jgi:hypothetical protein
VAAPAGVTETADSVVGVASATSDSLPPTTVTLTTDRTVISAGQSATLTATVNQPLQNSSSRLEIWDVSNSSRLSSCSSGVTCSTSTVFYTGGPREYEARVNGLVSGRVTVEREPWSVSLSVDRSVLSAGQLATLTAVANQNTGNTSNTYHCPTRTA